MRLLRLPSLVLTALLQVLPVVRTVAVVNETASPVLAIIFRWVAAAAAAYGSVQAVSGASTFITNPLSANATNGVPFRLRLTTAPDQAHYWTASGLPSGIALQGTSGQAFWQLTGTPHVAGAFTVRLTAKDKQSSGSDRTISANLALTVYDQFTAPTITLQPRSLTVNAGDLVRFAAAATGTDPLTYQWFFNNQVVNGANAPTLTLDSATAADAGDYTLQVSNDYGSDTSQPATLVVNTPQVAPQITRQPTAEAAYVGENVSFSVLATGTPPPVYQWFLNQNDLPGATNETLALSNIQETDAGDYGVRVSNETGNVTSDLAALTVHVLQITSFTNTTSGSVLSFDALQGRMYGVEGRGSLAEGQWSVVQQVPPPATNGAFTVTIPKDPLKPSEYFRITLIAP